MKTYKTTFTITYTWQLDDDTLVEMEKDNTDPRKALISETAENICVLVEDEPESIHEYITIEEV